LLTFPSKCNVASSPNTVLAVKSPSPSIMKENHGKMYSEFVFNSYILQQLVHTAFKFWTVSQNSLHYLCGIFNSQASCLVYLQILQMKAAQPSSTLF
jgi:hypothetical protein